MATQANVTAASDALRAIWNGADGNELRARFAQTFTFHNLNGYHEVTDLANLRQRLAALHGAHPGARLQVEGTVGAGSHVALDWTIQESRRNGGQRSGESSPSALRSGTFMVRFAEEKVGEIWELTGELAA